MSRTIPWRRTCSDVVHWRQLQALQARIYVLQESGPTAFVVKEEDNPKKFRVTLGDPSRCTCATYTKERDLCLHICWIILKLFRLPPENSISWQGSLVEREIQQLINSRRRVTPVVRPATNNNSNNSDHFNTEVQTVQPRKIEDGDCCPICQDDMTSTQNLTYCRYSCGHYIHSRCMKMWADHQLSQGTKIHCPMCRAEFGTLQMIKCDHLKRPRPTQTQHQGVSCTNCRVAPIQGKVYQCTICVEYVLCMRCFATNTHNDHPFHFKEKPSDRWRPAVRDLRQVPPQLASELQNRDLSENDYETLLALDNHNQVSSDGGLSQKELSLLKCIMLTKNSSLLKNSEIFCNLCLAGYSISQHVVELPCSHKFHQICANNWLAHTHDYCPTCSEKVEVTVPVRRKQPVIRFNVKEEETEESRIEFSLSGAAVKSNPASEPNMTQSNLPASSSSSKQNTKVASLGLAIKTNRNIKPKHNPSSAGPALVLSSKSRVSDNQTKIQQECDRTKPGIKRGSLIPEPIPSDFIPDTTLAIDSLQSSSIGNFSSLPGTSISIPGRRIPMQSTQVLKSNSKQKLPSFINQTNDDLYLNNNGESSGLDHTPFTPPKDKHRLLKPGSKLKLPSFVPTPDETTSLNINNSFPGTTSRSTPPGKKRNKLSKPPLKPPKSNPEQQTPQPNLFIGSSENSHSPVDIVKRISSVHEKSRARRMSGSRNSSRSNSIERSGDHVRGNLVSVSGLKIST